MKKSSLLIFLLSIISFGNLTAQTFEIGTGLHFIRQKGAVLFSPDYGSPRNAKYSVDEAYHPLGIQFVYNKPVHKFDDNITICIQPGASFYAGLDFGSGEGMAGYVLPLYAAFRIGNGASRFSDKLLGGGIGVGPLLSGFATKDEKAILGTFAFMLEMKYKASGLRFEYPLKKYISHYNSYLGPITRVESGFWQIYYSFNLNYE